MASRRKLDPFRDTGKVEHKHLPMIKAKKVLISDPQLLERLAHISRPYRGGENLQYNEETLPNEDGYVDIEMLTLVLLNEVLHLRQQIGLVCEGAYLATNGHFSVKGTGSHVTPAGEKEQVYIEDFLSSLR